MEAGADAFRINMSHGDQARKAALVEAIRELEKESPADHDPGRSAGAKLRVGKFEGGSAMLERGQKFMLDREPRPGDANRVELPHPELFEAIGRATGS